MIVAIDGPSGAGKSTVSQLVAQKLGYACLDTGAMYRCVAWKALDLGVSIEDGEALGKIAQDYDIEFGIEPGSSAAKTVCVGGTDVTSDIRCARIDRCVSPVAAVPAVRIALVDQQRRIGRGGNFVVEGRDIGTVVFPDAAVKVFLTASDEERARRRVAQNQQRGVGSTDFEEVLRDLKRRDDIDSNRAASPLKPADDAVMLDSTSLTQDQVVEAICKLAQEAENKVAHD